MHISRPKLWILLFSLALGQWADAQTIWPGDVNNSGKVTIVDVLYHGLAFGATGPVRPDGSSDWEGQPAGLPWSQNFPNGLNFAYADGNGDGTVDDNDLDEVIQDNFGEQHGTVMGDGFAAGTPGSTPALRLQPTAGIVQTGTAITIDLFLEGATGPVEGFYGVALQLSYQTSAGSETDDFEFMAADTPWYDPAGTNSIEFFVEDDDDNTAGLAVVRKDQLTVSGEGRLGQFSVVIEDIIAIERVDTFTLSIDSVLVVGEDLSPRAVVADQTRVIVADDPASVTATTDTRRQTPAPLRVYPNPARTHCRAVTARAVEQWQLVGFTGKSYPLSATRRTDTEYDITFPAGLPAGIYFLRGITARGIIQQRITLHS